jgi:predicted nucleic acid-binding protein
LGLIVDTNALSAIIDGDRAIKPIVQRAPSVEVSVVTLGEYRFGILRSSRPAAAERWLRDFLHLYKTLDVDKETSFHYAELRFALKRAGTPIPLNDLWIAAQARQYDLSVLSRDKHFDAVGGIRRISW